MESASSDTLKEILRQAEAHLNSQLTAAIAADQRAYTFAGLCTASCVLLLGGAYGAITATEPDRYLVVVAFLVAICLFAASWMAVVSARAADFDFCGSRSGVWAPDIQEGKSIERSLAEQCEHCDSSINSNREAMEANSSTFNRAVNLALSSVGLGALAFLFWLREPLGL